MRMASSGVLCAGACFGGERGRQAASAALLRFSKNVVASEPPSPPPPCPHSLRAPIIGNGFSVVKDISRNKTNLDQPTPPPPPPPPSVPQVAPLVVRAVRESVFYETSADPIRFSLLGLDLITRQQAPPPPPTSDAPAGAPQDGAGDGEGDGEGDIDGDGGGSARWGVSGQDRWFFTFLLCKLLSG